MARAVELAASGRFRVEPNPLVGCVLVKGGRVVAEGHHAYWGGPHAEAMALNKAGPRAKGATAYVTLEPCGHKGKTPPCAGALLRAGVKEVVYAHVDPHPVTAGAGPALLREGGVRVRKAPVPAALRKLMAPYLAHVGLRRPWVVAKWAMSADGRTATRTGDSKWISSEVSRRWAHRNLRAHADAILVGAETVRTDDPELTNRSGRGRQPLRVVVCGRNKIPRRSRVLTDGGATLLAAPTGFRAPPRTEVMACGQLGRVDPKWLLKGLYERGLRRLLLEGGGALAGAFFDRQLVDQVAIFLAPRILGGRDAPAPVGGRGRATVDQGLPLEHPLLQNLGGDQLLEGYLSG
jgi:diaminohydroxyphosphoribosylaminopyrimidine deaminase/5-amino-6-(5-phosphoribosylamino)uracil reductase